MFSFKAGKNILRRLYFFVGSLLLGGALFALVGDFCQKKTKGFCLQKIFSKTPLLEKEPFFSPSELSNIQSVLSQPYFFLKKGQQCYVFVSQDQKYILKFLKWSQIEPSFLEKALPYSWAKNRQK